MRVVPFLMRGASRGALRLAMNEAVFAHNRNDVPREERAWKLFFLLPRMLLTGPPRGGKISPAKLEERIARFTEACAVARTAVVRKRRRHTDQDRKVARAERLVMLGELSSARQVLESGHLAPGNLSTLRALTDPEKRPPVHREPVPRELLTGRPVAPFQLDEDKLALNIRKARRGAAPGPSGTTSEHLFPLLESEDDMGAFVQFAGILARGDIPPLALEVIRRGRMSALRKANGVRGIVVGDVLRRLVARTIAQQIGAAVELDTAPFQYALKTRAGCECVSHTLQTLLDLDPRATVLSVDGVGAFDFISRNSMMAGLAHLEEGDKLLPFVRLFYSSPSTFLWEDDAGTTHHIRQGEVGEQGDPLMPLLFALVQHTAPSEASGRMREGERLMAFLDDLCAVSPPDRTVECHNVMAEELCQPGRIRLNQGKTCAFNKSGEAPTRIEALQAAAARVDQDARVWRGDLHSGPSGGGNHHSGHTRWAHGSSFWSSCSPKLSSTPHS